MARWQVGPNLGYFETAEEAALHVARTPEGQAAAALPPPMAAKGALAQAGAEGLTLTRSDLQSGFRNVYVTHNKKTAVPRKGAGRRQACLPWLYFKTAEEAALHVARTPEGQTAAALPPPMTAKGAGQAAAALPPPMTAKGGAQGRLPQPGRRR